MTNTDNLENQIIDGAEILYDRRTDTTRWVIWRHPATRKLSLIISQNGQVVSVNIENVLYFVDRILTQFTNVQRSTTPRATADKL